ncbi:MAG: mannose-1-phosphate guanylyltransferase [Terriglobia bacterium]
MARDPAAYAIILAGGYGTRFWPLSRRVHPKQFLSFAGKESLLQQTYRRVARLFPRQQIYVVGNAEHRALLTRQLPRLPRGRLLLEPLGRNTAAAIALAAEHIRVGRAAKAADPVLAVFPADHTIRQDAGFRRIVRAAVAAAAATEDVMVVLGIPPTHPHTGYGYIERGSRVGRIGRDTVFTARRFTEKPNRPTATRYLRTRRYSWNSGMFFWRLSTFDRLLAGQLPRTRAALGQLAHHIGRRDYPLRLKRLYPRLENISVDYALAEPAAARGRARVLAADIGWSDLGSWSALYEWRAARPGENIIAGPHFLLDATGNWLGAEGPPKADAPRAHKFVAAIGVRDLIVVDTPDALLLCSRPRAQEVGKVVHYLQKKKRHQLL